MSDVIIKAVSPKRKDTQHKNASSQRSIRHTQQYIDDEKKHGHKVLVLDDVKVQGSFNLLATDRHSQIEEIKARHNQYKGKAKKCEHYVLSYAKGKPPTSYGRQDFEKDVQEFMECMGMPEHAVLYAVHQNTDNVHIHILLDRVARIPKGGKFYVPTDTGAVVKTRKDGTKQRHDPDCMQTAIARICNRNKWQGGNIRCDADGKPSLKKRKGIKKQPPHIDPKKVEFMLLVNGIFSSSSSWYEAQEKFEREGISFKVKMVDGEAKGASISRGDVWAKMSELAPNNSFTNLEERWGMYCEVILGVFPNSCLGVETYLSPNTLTVRK